MSAEASELARLCREHVDQVHPECKIPPEVQVLKLLAQGRAMGWRPVMVLYPKDQ